VPVTLPVCRVPNTFPASSFFVCVAINACDIGMKPVNTPIMNRNKKSCQTDVANPISINNTPSPVADIIKIFFRPYLSQIVPQIVEKITAKKKNLQNDVANPISINDTASPVADIIKIFFRPYLSPIRPQIGEKIKAVINVTANTQPDHV